MSEPEWVARYRASQPLPPAAACPSAATLQGVAHGTTPPADRLALADHLSRCPACRRELALLDAAVQLAPPRAPAVPWTRVAMAASALLAVGIGWRALRVREPPAEVLRGGTSAAASPPASITTITAGERISWAVVPGAVSYDLELLDAEGRLVGRCTTADTSCVLVSPADAPSPAAGRDLELVVRSRALDGVESVQPAQRRRWR
jgi:hypothetical protein